MTSAAGLESGSHQRTDQVDQPDLSAAHAESLHEMLPNTHTFELKLEQRHWTGLADSWADSRRKCHWG